MKQNFDTSTAVLRVRHQLRGRLPDAVPRRGQRGVRFHRCRGWFRRVGRGRKTGRGWTSGSTCRSRWTLKLDSVGPWTCPGLSSKMFLQSPTKQPSLFCLCLKWS